MKPLNKAHWKVNILIHDLHTSNKYYFKAYSYDITGIKNGDFYQDGYSNTIRKSMESWIAFAKRNKIESYVFDY